jgi:hypothetical protein
MFSFVTIYNIFLVAFSDESMRLYKSILGFIIPVLIVGGCLDIPEKLVVPEWDVDFNIPLVNRVYTIDDVIGEQENIEVEPDSIYLIHTREYTQVRNLLDFIKLEGAVNEENISIPPLNGSRDIFLDFRSDVVEIESATFSGGDINLNIRNTSSLTVSFIITVPGIRLSQSPLVLSASLAPGENTMIMQDLAGYTYSDPPNQPPLLRNTLWIQAEANAAGTNTGGNVEFDVEISDFFFSSVTGRFSEQDVGRKSDTISADLGRDLDDFRNKIHLASAALRISAEYRSVFENPFNLRIDSLTIAAVSDNGEIYLTDSTGSRYINLFLDQGTIDINFNESNSNLIEIINSVPDNFIISASFRILGGNQSGTITNEDLSNIRLDISTRSILALARSTITDTLRIWISDDERDRIRDAQLTNFSLDILNYVPVKGWLRIDFLDSLRNRTFTLRVENDDSLMIQGAIINEADGNVTSPSVTFRHVDLTREEILQLAESYFVIARVSIETSSFRETDPPLVIIRASDWMKVNIYGRVKYHVDL